MFVTSESDRAGLLVAIVTGGRPAVKQRPTANFINDLHAAGVHDVVWSISSKDAPNYEPTPGADLSVYDKDWAHEYASSHWMRPGKPEPGQFLGAFPGREWACLEAERRGCWGVLQLDDNIHRLGLWSTNANGRAAAIEAGGMGAVVDLLAAVTLSTNGWMVGAQLGATPPSGDNLARPGFPYSLFIERVGPRREHWYGPFEDDITHAIQYGTRWDGATAVVCDPLRYYKVQGGDKSGMRKHYKNDRSVHLQRIFPQAADLKIMKTTSAGHGPSRVFHRMKKGAIRNPLTIRDPDLYQKALARTGELSARYSYHSERFARKKINDRARKAGLLPDDEQ